MRINMNELLRQVEETEKVGEVLALPRVEVPGRYVVEPHAIVDRSEGNGKRKPNLIVAWKVVGVDESYQWWEDNDHLKKAKEQKGRYVVDFVYLTEKALGRIVYLVRSAGIDVEVPVDKDGNVEFEVAKNAYTTALMEKFKDIGKVVVIVSREEREVQEYDPETDEFVVVKTTNMSVPYNAYRPYTEK